MMKTSVIHAGLLLAASSCFGFGQARRQEVRDVFVPKRSYQMRGRLSPRDFGSSEALVAGELDLLVSGPAKLGKCKAGWNETAIEMLDKANVQVVGYGPRGFGTGFVIELRNKSVALVTARHCLYYFGEDNEDRKKSREKQYPRTEQRRESVSLIRTDNFSPLLIELQTLPALTTYTGITNEDVIMIPLPRAPPSVEPVPIQELCMEPVQGKEEVVVAGRFFFLAEERMEFARRAGRSPWTWLWSKVRQHMYRRKLWRSREDLMERFVITAGMAEPVQADSVSPEVRGAMTTGAFHSCSTSWGMSGGPVYSTSRGRIVGLHVGCTRPSNGRQNFFASLDFLRGV